MSHTFSPLDQSGHSFGNSPTLSANGFQLNPSEARSRQCIHSTLLAPPLNPSYPAASPRSVLTVKDKQLLADYSPLPLEEAMAAHLISPRLQEQDEINSHTSPVTPVALPTPISEEMCNSFDFELLPSAMNARRGMKMAKLSTIECKYGRKCYREDCRFAHSFVERRLYGPAPKPAGLVNKKERKHSTTHPTSRSASSSPIFEPRVSNSSWPRGQSSVPAPRYKSATAPPGFPVPADFNNGAVVWPENHLHSAQPTASWRSTQAMPSVITYAQPLVACRSPPPRASEGNVYRAQWPQPQWRLV